jgi:hypothetical protein
VRSALSRSRSVAAPLEIEVGRGGFHLVLERGDLGVELGLRAEHLARLARRVM